jgi:5-hydroxyisourate hydrolase-like protein (transthyretin family)
VTGGAALLFRLHHASGSTESRHSLTIQRAHRILLTTDKPLYQPGQTMHLRVLATRLPHGLPSGGEDVTLEVQDGKGNKVFREETRTNEFGIAAAEFTLARLVNMGRYTLRATVGETMQERTVTVERYALPKFAVDFTADRPFYLPGERVIGQVDARYFFGQPVAGGAVTVRASQYDVDWVPFAELHGTTDEAGHWDFAVDLPTYFVGLPLEQGGSFAKLEIEVTDTAGQVFSVERPLTVARGAVQPVLIPEGSVLVPGVPNAIYLLTADPTGTPISATCRVSIDGGPVVPVQTDERGFASFEVTPAAGASVQVRVEVDDERAGTISQWFRFDVGGSATETVLLRTDKSLYAVGETAVLSIYTPRDRDRVYLDAVRAGQTVLSKTIDVGAGWTNEFLDIDPNLAGSVTFSVYFLGERGEIVRDQRVVFVEGAGDLELRITPDRDRYRPAETARLDLAVRHAADGTPVRAAVGLQVVDEAVFALSESQPGLEKIYFELEEDLAEPRYEIHGYDPATVLGVGGEATPEEREDAARVLFAAAAGRSVYGIEYASERNLLATVQGHTQTAVQADARRIGEALDAYLVARGDSSQEAAQRWVERMRDGWYDPWGQRYQADYEWYQLSLRSAGTDERWGTDDDVQAWNWGGGGDDWLAEDAERNGPTAGAAADAGADDRRVTRDRLT